jgi:hypothetical protein
VSSNRSEKFVSHQWLHIKIFKKTCTEVLDCREAVERHALEERAKVTKEVTFLCTQLSTP